MSLPRSTYYHLSKNHSGDDSELITQIEAIIEEFPGYGYRRVTLNWYSHSGHLEKSDIENKLIEVRDDNRKKELFKAI